jgi:hypothetical protein
MEVHCPYCQRNVTPVYEAVVALHAKRPEDTAAVLCVMCGEPMMLQGDTFRRATTDEFVELVKLEDYNRNRAVWLEGERLRHIGRGPPVAHMWTLLCKEIGMDFANDAAEESYRRIFYNGVAMATAYFKEAVHQEDYVFTGRMNLLEAELEASALADITDEPEAFEHVADVLLRVIENLKRSN